MTTGDISVQSGDILEFSILMAGCNATGSISGSGLDILNPVALSYSNDYGESWNSVVDECLPFNRRNCAGSSATTASIYYQTNGWTRITIPLDDPIVSKLELIQFDIYPKLILFP